MTKSTITRERLQEIVEDGFLKHGESKEMARMLLAAQAHITELEAAPPAPVGPGEEPVPVMPDFPGKVMTQRECWQAGKEVGLAEGRSSAAIPVGYVMVPMRLTAENGAKAALLGEFNLEYSLTCHECFGEGCDDCSGEGTWTNTIPIDWTTIKEIWAKGVEHFAAAPPAPKQENI